MKIALYIEDGREQIVLTPQTDSETSILAKLHGGTREISLHRGEFYACAGGWTRHGQGSERSTIIVLETPNQENPK